MRIEIDRGPYPLEIAGTEERLRRTFAALASRIESLRLVLADLNGPRGGADKRASLMIRLRGGGEVKAEQTSSRLSRALGDCLARARRGLIRRSDRRRRKPRPTGT